jgi:hypothetical protein
VAVEAHTAELTETMEVRGAVEAHHSFMELAMVELQHRDKEIVAEITQVAPAQHQEVVAEGEQAQPEQIKATVLVREPQEEREPQILSLVLL